MPTPPDPSSPPAPPAAAAEPVQPAPAPPAPTVPQSTEGLPPAEILPYQPAWSPALVPRHSPWLLSLLSNGWIVVLIVALYFLEDVARYLPRPVHNLLPSMAITIALAATLQLIVAVTGRISLGHAAFYFLGVTCAGYLHDLQFSSYLPLPLYAISLVVAFLAYLAGLLAVLWMLRWSGRVHALLPPGLLALSGAALIAAGPQAVSAPFWWLDGAAAEILLAWFGNRLFAPGLLHEIPSIIIVSAAAAAIAAIAWLIARASMGRHPAVLPVTTLAFAMLVQAPVSPTRILIRWPNGISSTWVLAGAAVCVLAAWRLARSALGRSAAAGQESELAAATAGIDAPRQQMRIFILACTLAGMTGAIACLTNPFAFTMPYSTYPGGRDVYMAPGVGLMVGFELLAIVIIAGRRSLSGVVITAAVLSAAWSFEPFPMQPWRLVIYAVAMVLLVRYRPQGLFGSWEIVRSRSALPGRHRAGEGSA